MYMNIFIFLCLEYVLEGVECNCMGYFYNLFMCRSCASPTDERRFAFGFQISGSEQFVKNCILSCI